MNTRTASFAQALRPTIGIFVSSTFRDFHLERDLLAGPLSTALNEIAAGYGMRVEVIDLRWGIESDNLSEDEASVRVLEVCRTEIESRR